MAQVNLLLSYAQAWWNNPFTLWLRAVPCVKQEQCVPGPASAMGFLNAVI